MSQEDASDRLGPTGLRRVVAVLCVTQITSWGVLFYAFPVLATSIAAAEGWSSSGVVGAFTVGLIVSGVAGLWVGRHIDRHGPRRIMTLGSLVGVAATAGLATAPTYGWFVAAWVVAGLAMSATLYAPAFAAVTHWAGPRNRVRALTTITLVAGLASTVFAPLTAWLLGRGDWRSSYLLLAVVLTVTVPLHWWGLRGPWQHTTRTGEPGSRRGAAPYRHRDLALLTVAMTLGGFAIYAVVVNLIPLLVEHGISTGLAATALGVGGIGQVAGRLLYGPLVTRLGVRSRTVAVFGAAALTIAALAVVDGPYLAVAAVSFLAGSVRGIFTLVQATAVADRWGTAAYGARSGVINGGVVGASAVAPWLGATMAASLGSQRAAFLGLAAVAVLAAAISGVTTAPRPSGDAPSSENSEDPEDSDQPKRPEM